MTPTGNGSTVLQHFECGNAIELCNRIMFNFYPGLPHMYTYMYTYSFTIYTCTPSSFLLLIPHTLMCCHSFLIFPPPSSLFSPSSLPPPPPPSSPLLSPPPPPPHTQYSSAKDGSALGVAVTRTALLTHCRSLTTACLYREGELTSTT